MMDTNVFFAQCLLLILNCNKHVLGWSCPSTFSKVYSRVSSNTEIHFDISSALPGQNEGKSFTVQSFDGRNIAIIRYAFGNIILDPPDVISGTSAGNVVVILKNVQLTDAGTYRIFFNTGALDCDCLYILGTPTQPRISINKDPAVGESVTLTCSSTSTTTPSNHSLSLTYNWTVDNVAISASSKYSFSTRKERLTVSNVQKEDASKQFTCSASEYVIDGYTSNSSSIVQLNVLYGPDSLSFNPSTTNYEKMEDTNLDPVTCSASCNPECTFKWTKLDQRSVVGNEEVLRLGQLTSSDAGTYRCTATHSGGSSKTKDLTVSVIYGPRSMSFTPATTLYRKDENVDLPPITCSSECWECSYSWSGPNLKSNSNPVLDLDRLSRSMSGNYSCTATNIKTSQPINKIKTVQIEVRYGPDSVTVVPGNQTYIVDEGSILQDMKCSADCFPECKYRWTKEGQTQSVSNTETLSLGILRKSSAGKYTCTATNGDTSSKRMQRHVIITVRYGPYNSSTSLTPAAEEYTRNEGTNLSDITCSADCYPACTYTWYKNHQTSSLFVGNRSNLSLGQLTPDEAASYICTARNPGKMNSPTTSVQVKVYVRYGPESLAISVQSPFIVTEGKTVADIICSSECYPGCSYSWTNTTANSISSSSSSLSLRKVNRYMAGSYNCTGWNTATNYYTKVKEKTIDIIVNYAPDVSIRFSTTNVTEGANLTLFCEGAGVPSSYSYTSLTQKWNNIRIHNNNTELEESEKFSSIHFDRLTLQDSGTYTCTLNNGIRNTFGVLNQTGSENILVKALPKFLKNELRFTGATGGIANIQVPVYSYPSYTSLHFVKGENNTIVSGQKYNITEQSHTVKSTFYNTDVMLNGTLVNFTITDLEEGDFGNYTLQITNDLGMSSVKVTAIAQGRPSSPRSFQFLSEYSIPTFMWVKNFNGGLNQSFVIQISVADTDKWTNYTDIKENDQQFKINDTFFMANITNLPPGIYSARIFAYNTKGESGFDLLNQTFEVKHEEETSSSLSVPAVVGGTVSALIVIALGAVVLILVKRRAGNKDGIKTKLNSRKHVSDDDNEDQDEVNTVNPMYVSADEVPPAHSTYAQPIKKKAAEVSQVYAMVDKKHKKPNTDGDIYENAPASKAKTNTKHVKGGKKKAFEDSPYENPESCPTMTPKKLVNKDGLIYADLAFNDQPKGQRKLIIHGLDDMTEYVQVDFSKKADPLPDSDEEDSKNKG